jgi:hypothetical protein
MQEAAMTTTTLDAFPRRPLTLKAGRSSLGAWLGALGGMLLFGGFLVMVALDVGPAIRDDFAIAAQAKPVAGARITEGRCRSKVYLLQSCDLTIAWRGKDGMVTRELSYLFVEPHMGGWSAQPMADPARPDLITTDLGLERLWNRAATAVGAVVVAIALIVGLLAAARAAQSRGRSLKALSGQELRAVPVQFAGWGEGPSWRVRDESGAVFEWPVKKSDKPFVLDAERGLVLALRAPQGGPAFPLDAALRLVDLRPEERAAVLAAQPA